MYYFPVITSETANLPLYIKTIGETPDEKRVELPCGISSYQLLYTESGGGILEINNKKYSLRAGDLFIISPNMSHNYYNIQRPWKTIWVTFNGSAVRTIININYMVLKLSDSEFLYDFLYKSLLLTKNTYWNKVTSVYLYEFLLEIQELIKSETHSDSYSPKKKLDQVISFIHNHYEKPIEIQELCDIINVSKTHLCRLFKKAYNMRPFEYITLIRLQKSKELLLTCPDIKISELIKKIGYEDESYFCKKFKEYNNMTPNQFKKYGYLK